MGNRSFLYLASSGNEGEALEEIAEANNVFPTMWKILLAQGESAAPIEYQRVFGDAGTDNIAVPVDGALQRLEAFANFTRADESCANGVALYFDGALQYFNDRIAHWQSEVDSPLVFSANLDELSWMDSDDPKEFIRNSIASCSELWRDIKASIDANDYSRIDELLEFKDYRLKRSDWQAWANVFGFAGVSHEYFSRSEEAPYEIAYADYDPDNDASGDNYLHDEYFRFKEDKLWGVKRDGEGTSNGVVLAAQWDRVLTLVHGERDVDNEYVLIKKGEQFGLAAYAGPRAGQIIFPPSVDELFAFAEGFAAVRREKKFGYLRRDGHWLLEPTWDDAWDFCHGMAAVARGRKQGFIDANGREAIEPKFDVVEPFIKEGVAKVSSVEQRGGQFVERFGLVRRDGSFALPLDCEQLEWSDEFSGWLVHRDKLVGLRRANGDAWIEPMWDSIRVGVPKKLVLVKHDRMAGLLDWSGAVVMQSEYSDLQPRYENLKNGLPIQFFARHGAGMGLIDQTNKALAPIDFSKLENFESPNHSAGFEALIDNFVRAYAMSQGKQKGTEKNTVGVWNVQQQRLTVPCTYSYIWLLKLGAGDKFGFWVATQRREPGAPKNSYRVGILRTDGTDLVPAEYRWIGVDRAPNQKNACSLITTEIYNAWATGKQVAAQTLGGDSVWIKADGTRVSQTDLLAEEYAAGKLASAMTLAELYRDNEELRNDELARLWMGRAAGAEPLPAGKKIGLTEAMIQYAWMLDKEVGGPRDAEGARHWLVLAYKQEMRDPRILRHLASLLWDEAAGPVDYKLGAEYFSVAAYLKDSTSTYNLALAYRDAIGVDVDRKKAAELFATSAELGFVDGEYQGGILYAELAREDGVSDADREHYFAEAARLLQLVVDGESSDVAQACVALAALHLTGEGVPQDVNAATSLLERGAELDDESCMRLLVEDVYGNSRLPTYDKKKAAMWKEKLDAKVRERSPLLRMFEGMFKKKGE